MKKNKTGRPKGSKSSYTMTEKARQQRKNAGLATLAKHGRGHFKELGQLGSLATWTKYKKLPHPGRPGEYMIIDRTTKKIIWPKFKDPNDPPQNPD